MLKYIFLGAFGAVVALMVYVRLAPLNVETQHAVRLPVGAAGEFTAAGSHTVLRDVPSATAALEKLDAIITATPRTTRVAGSVGDGRMTYVTRSRIMGFPYFTTISAGPPDATRGRTMATLAVFGRLRYGKADLGVNRARIESWLAQFDEATS